MCSEICKRRRFSFAEQQCLVFILVKFGVVHGQICILDNDDIVCIVYRISCLKIYRDLSWKRGVGDEKYVVQLRFDVLSQYAVSIKYFVGHECCIGYKYGMVYSSG
ncbi:hypothetical protein CEXT_69261 [Caerostris extrusa]|uniref:Uncharacterized protein n=1 Tax=Caerostris extrusa TaxID=172846 RepID=A0AAV4MDC4_CAEEX|nr:hypothetical protein CEXT_69261 [Caerostris extrusa]